MPTGYTSDLADGKVSSFPEFAMSCARAFGALITMRDDPADAPIPDEFKPSDYNAKRLQEAQTELCRLEAMTAAEQTDAALAFNVERLASWRRGVDDTAARRKRYETMLAKVRGWQPPTLEHNGLKEFMVRQIEESIRFDCHPPSAEPQPVDPARWYADALAGAHKDIAYHSQEQANEIERARKRTEWVSALRESLFPKLETV